MEIKKWNKWSKVNQVRTQHNRSTDMRSQQCAWVRFRSITRIGLRFKNTRILAYWNVMYWTSLKTKISTAFHFFQISLSRSRILQLSLNTKNIAPCSSINPGIAIENLKKPSVVTYSWFQWLKNLNIHTFHHIFPYFDFHF